MSGEQRPLGVIGLGWVGLVTAACFAELGRRVIGVEVDGERLSALRSGELPFHEPGLAELVERNSERLEVTDDVASLGDAEIAFVCVGTPPTHSGDADLSAVNQAARQLAELDGPGLVMKSTVPVGTGAAVQAAHPGLSYVACPEFLREGTAVSDFMEPDRVVVGAGPGSEDTAEAVVDAYSPLGATLLRTDVASAEMIKLASNAFLATKISFINEIANVCEEVGADVSQVAEGMGLDARIGSGFLRPGIGYGGSCFPKDVAALKVLAGNSGYHFQLLSSVIEVNELQKRRVISKLTKHLDSLRGRRVALLGLAFKPDTDDMREASSLVLASRLQGEGAEVTAYDPIAAEAAAALLPDVEICTSAMDALEGVDAAVLVTEWQELVDLDWSDAAARMSNPLVVDGRNCLDPSTLSQAGITLEAIGRDGGG